MGQGGLMFTSWNFIFSMVFTVKEVYLLHNIEKSPCRELKMEYGNGKAVRNLLSFLVK